MSGKGFGLFFEMGCGKSLTALAIMGALHEQGLIRRVLVIAPGSVVSVWEDELKKFADFPYMFSALLGTKAQRLKKLAALEDGERIATAPFGEPRNDGGSNGGADGSCVPGGHALRECQQQPPCVPPSKGGGSVGGADGFGVPGGHALRDGRTRGCAPTGSVGGAVGFGVPGGHALRGADGGTELLVAGINYESVWRDEIFEALIKFGPELVICDESQRIKNHKAQQTVAAVELAKRAKYRLALSGTPITQDVQDLFSQYDFLDSTVFGENFYSYRNRYCLLGGFGGKKVIGTKSEDELSNRMYSIAYRVTKAEALDLPPETFLYRKVELSPKERKLYDEMRRNAYIELSAEQEVSATTVLTKLLRLQQIAGGFIKADGEERVQQIGSSKMDALEDILEDYVLGEGRQLVIFARFIPEIDGICDLLRKKGISYHRITGDVALEERGQRVSEFQSGHRQCFVAQIQTAGLGITLHAASAAVFYSVGYNLADYQQALARIHRKGQTQPCTYIILQGANTVDQKVMEALEKKSDVAKRICDDWQMFFS